jgi:ATP/maltotriose-dependent transcriptional regulator MalT
MEFNRQTKVAAINAMKQQEQEMDKRINNLVLRGDSGDYPQQRGCGGGCFPWFGRGRSRIAQDSSTEVAIFGQSAAGGSTANANARLEKAAVQMENHAEQLYAKAGASRAKAKALMAQGKKAEAMAALKRVKQLEKQAEVATSTHAAIEQQKDMLESSALQREVATALSASIATTKKKTRGLLEKAESAVDGSAELRDAADEISEVMGGLATNDHYDEDELLEELELMARESHAETAAAAEEAPAPAAKALVEPQAIVVGIDPELYPKAPSSRKSKREQKKRLLADDAAAAAAVA